MSSMLERISLEKGIVDFNGAPDTTKLMIYIIAITEMYTSLVKEDLETFPVASLDEFKKGLKEIVEGFYKLRTRPIGNQLSMKQIIPIVEAANSHLIAALPAIRKGKRTYATTQHLQKCRSKLFDTLEQLEGF